MCSSVERDNTNNACKRTPRATRVMSSHGGILFNSHPDSELHISHLEIVAIQR